ncbi:MAG: NUDIX domain-containing protein [Thermoleophilia bacterium]
MRTVRHESAGGVVVRVEGGRPWVAVIRPAGRAEGHWTLPKGTCEPGEPAVDTAVREVWEETGLRCEAGQELPESRYFYVHEGVRVAKRVRFWLMRAVDGTIDAIDPAMRVEVAEARWLALQEAERDLAYRSDRECVAHVARALGEAE